MSDEFELEAKCELCDWIYRETFKTKPTPSQVKKFLIEAAHSRLAHDWREHENEEA